MPKGIYKRTLETRKRMSIAFTGRKMPQGMKDKISKIHKGKKISDRQRKEHSHFMKKRMLIPEVKNKAILNLNLSGENHPNWKGGISFTKEYRARQYLLSRRKRRNIKLSISGFHSEEQWSEMKKKYNYTCLCCKKIEPEIKLSRDHIVPINKKGSDDISNIQPLCKSCNSKKHTKIIKYEITI